MDSLTSVVVPALALVISVGTFVLTSHRADQTDLRTVSRDTVEMLAQRNATLGAEIAELRARISHLEQLRTDWDRERAMLLALLPRR